MSTQNQEASTTAKQVAIGTDRSFIQRWKHQILFDKGFLVVPSRFLQLYSKLKPYSLTTGEALFVLHLMEFKWDASAPFPGYKTLAQRMGVTDKMARRYAQSLETKNYLRREIRRGQTNRFDLTLLFDALAKAVAQEAKKEGRTSAKKKLDKGEKLIEWQTKLITALNSLPDTERKELESWRESQVGNKNIEIADWPKWEEYIGKKPS